jgi:hypothetical protein
MIEFGAPVVGTVGNYAVCVLQSQPKLSIHFVPLVSEAQERGPYNYEGLFSAGEQVHVCATADAVLAAGVTRRSDGTRCAVVYRLSAGQARLIASTTMDLDVAPYRRNPWGVSWEDLIVEDGLHLPPVHGEVQPFEPPDDEDMWLRNSLLPDYSFWQTAVVHDPLSEKDERLPSCLPIFHQPTHTWLMSEEDIPKEKAEAPRAAPTALENPFARIVSTLDWAMDGPAPKHALSVSGVASSPAGVLVSMQNSSGFLLFAARGAALVPILDGLTFCGVPSPVALRPLVCGSDKAVVLGPNRAWGFSNVSRAPGLLTWRDANGLVLSGLNSWKPERFLSAARGGRLLADRLAKSDFHDGNWVAGAACSNGTQTPFYLVLRFGPNSLVQATRLPGKPAWIRVMRGKPFLALAGIMSGLLRVRESGPREALVVEALALEPGVLPAPPEHGCYFPIVRGAGVKYIHVGNLDSGQDELWHPM